MRRTILLFPALFLCALYKPAAATPITIETVPIGNPSNPGIQGFPRGSVAYNYRIGTYEVTNAQYAEFLNAKAQSDPLALYNANMGSNARGGITRSGVSGSFTYSTRPNMGNKPVNFVSWCDAVRFANWLHNGQGNGSTENGAYILLGGTPLPTNFSTITRNVGATWFLPNDNEWYKAAYYQPAAQGGPNGDYWLYPTASNTIPIKATANAVGDISNPGANVANYDRGADWNGQDGNVTTVGSAGLASKNFYGTYDQAGNVVEWSEFKTNAGPQRYILGGSWFNPGIRNDQQARVEGVTSELDELGFRLATVPELSALVLAAVGGLLLLIIRRRVA